MTDSATTSPPGARTALGAGGRPGKRERLVAAACELFHRRGVTGTSLADIAEAADVPLGNVYYYFKTKDDIVRAVIDVHVEALRAGLRTFDRHRSAPARLIAFTREVAGTSASVAAYGCPDGTLCSELDKREDDLAESAATLMRVRVDWAREQFRLMGRKDAGDLALSLIARVQGAALLANTFRDPAVLAGEARQLQRWIRSLA
jgi:TetR/AcrR family transcriptional regulator, transcriptional repressor for nem operon